MFQGETRDDRDDGMGSFGKEEKITVFISMSDAVKIEHSVESFLELDLGDGRIMERNKFLIFEPYCVEITAETLIVDICLQ